MRVVSEWCVCRRALRIALRCVWRGRRGCECGATNPAQTEWRGRLVDWLCMESADSRDRPTSYGEWVRMGGGRSCVESCGCCALRRLRRLFSRPRGVFELRASARVRHSEKPGITELWIYQMIKTRDTR